MPIRIARFIRVLGIALALSISLQARSSLHITFPTDGTVVHPGETVTVVVLSAGPSFTHVLVIGEDPLGSCTASSGPPWGCTIQIPPDIDFNFGTYALTAVGVNTSGAEVDSDPIEVDVERPDSPIKIAADLRQLRLPVGGTSGIRILGTYSDGSVADLSRSTLTKYETMTAGILSVSKDGFVKAFAPGLTAIVVHHQDRQAMLKVVVTGK